jgi:hypothetical protein
MRRHQTNSLDDVKYELAVIRNNKDHMLRCHREIPATQPEQALDINAWADLVLAEMYKLKLSG